MGFFTLRRIGWRAELGIGLTVAVIAVGVISYTVLAGAATPQQAAMNYLAAQQHGDSTTIWNQTYLDTSSTANVGHSLLTRQALQAQLTTSRPTYSGLRVERTDLNGNTASVELSFQQQNTRPHITLKLRKDPAHATMGVFPVWQVVVTPALLDFKLPKYLGGLSVDGVGIEVGNGDTQIAVFPGQHVLALAASDVFQATSVTISALQLAPATTAVPFAFTVLPSAQTTALAAVLTNLQNCTKPTTLQPSGCPNGLLGAATGPAKWTLWGDPTSGADTAVDPSLDLVAEGHYQMDVHWSGQGTFNGDHHDVVSGPYRALLAWDGAKWSIGGYADGKGVAAAPKPAATDDVVLQAVKKVFAACVASNQPSPADCPGSVVAFDYSGLTWTANGDQTSGAPVTWDGDRSVFTVKGNYSMTASWTESYPYGPTVHMNKTVAGAYTADLFWDGKAIEFITFE
jgi:hypothetical protein